MKLTSQNNRIRILHVVAGMNRGGVETWLMHVLRHIDKSRYQTDFLVHTKEACAYDEEIRGLGSRIIRTMHPSRPMYMRSLSSIMRRGGPYDVVHSHVHHFSGAILWTAARTGVPIRIAHSHSDTREHEATSSPARKAYLRLMKAAVTRYATVGLGCSGSAATALFGLGWHDDPRINVLYCGIDLEPFRQGVHSAHVRSELGLPENAFVVGHVGRFTPAKNHKFIIDVAAEIISHRKNVHFLLVGDGPLRNEIESRVRARGLVPHFTFTGMRNDVAQIMKGAMDLLMLPSLHEGLPLTCIEAQASGTLSLISQHITPEVDVVQDRVKRISLDAGAIEWSRQILCLGPKDIQKKSSSILTIERSPFDISQSVQLLTRYYHICS